LDTFNIQAYQIQPLSVTLTLNQSDRDFCSAYRLNIGNMCDELFSKYLTQTRVYLNRQTDGQTHTSRANTRR